MKVGLIVLLIGTILHSAAQKQVAQEIDSLNTSAHELRITEKSRSITLTKKAITLSEEANYEKGLYRAYLNLGINYTNLSKYDSAIMLLRRCEGHYDFSFESGLVQYYLGINFSNLSAFKKAGEYFDQALSIFQAVEEKKYSAYVYNSLGIIEGRQANYDQALEFFLRAYDMKLAADLPYDEELSNISIVYRLMDQLDKALEFSRKSLKIVEGLGDSLGLSETCVSIGNIFNSMAEPDSSIKYYDRSYAIAKKMKHPNQMASAIVNKADVLNQLNQPNRAIVLLMGIMELIEGDKSLEESINYELAKIYFGNKQYDQGIEYAIMTYRLSVLNRNLSLTQEVTLLISQLFEKRQQPDSALKYLGIHNKYLSDIYEENNSANIAELQVRIETLEKDNEIAALTAEKELERLRRERLLAGLIFTLVLTVIIIVLVIKRQQEKSKRQQLEKEKLRAEIDQAQENLYKQTIHMIHVNNCLDEIEEEIKKRANRNVELSNGRILNSIKVNKSLDKDWQNFNDYFANVHVNFYEQLSERSAALSHHDKRICALLKLGLSNREISTILNIETKSVSMLKYRIKKKLQLSEHTELSGYIQTL